MVEWKPLMGAIPPLNEAAWHEVFDKYKQFPEYQLLNKGMSLSEFKFIFFWEYAHRLLGRVIGLVFILPFLFFWKAGYLDRILFRKLLLGLCLGALQGLMGWYMVKSGLVDLPRVSHFRLAAHLGLAFLIEAYLIWLILELNSFNFETHRIHRCNRAYLGSILLLALVSLQIMYGAFVAGMKAGFGYNTYPLMNGEWIPAIAFSEGSLWKSLLMNNAMLQFVHRWLAIILLIAVLSYSVYFWPKCRQVGFRVSLKALLLALLIQIGLGIATLVYAVPISLATLHQLGAVLVLASLVALIFYSRQMDLQSQ